MGVPRFFSQFDFNLAEAVLAQLVMEFDELEPASLVPDNLSKVDREPGVYQLFLDDTLVYVGKADDNLSKRLGEHYLTITSRKNTNVDAVKFCCLSLHRNWAPLTHESLLIRQYKSEGRCEWNNSGIGNHDPGRKRDDWKPNVFDTQFPIDESLPCIGVKAGQYNGNKLLQAVKGAVPYTFRYETNGHWKSGHPDYNEITVDVPVDDMPAVEIIRHIASHLKGWQATLFPSHIILYKEDHEYESGTRII